MYDQADWRIICSNTADVAALSAACSGEEELGKEPEVVTVLGDDKIDEEGRRCRAVLIARAFWIFQPMAKLTGCSARVFRHQLLQSLFPLRVDRGLSFTEASASLLDSSQAALRSIESCQGCMCGRLKLFWNQF